MKMSKTMKRILAGFLSVTMVAGIFLGQTLQSTQDVQADTRVFSGITEKFDPNDANKQIKILEISTTADEYTANYYDGVDRKINKNSELGYFMPYTKTVAGYNAGNDNSSPEYLTLASKGGKFGAPKAYNAYVDAELAEYEKIILTYRDYGLVKPFGTDRGWINKIGDYPIYTKAAAFSSSKSDSAGSQVTSGSLVKGVYTPQEGGAYKLADGYELNENCQICTVSMNTISENGLPVEVKVYTPVTDINTARADLPMDSNGNYYITQANVTTVDGKNVYDGNLTFTKTEAQSTVNGRQEYYGYSDDPLWFARPGQDFSRSKNSGWFAEYVLGSYRKYANVDLDYTVKSANTVTAADVAKYDLIYISGKASEFANNDLTEATIKALYESTINEHKAIIMDYDGYDKAATTNYSKLAALLWQSSVTDLTSANEPDATNKDFAGLVIYESATKKCTLNLDVLDDTMLGKLKKKMLTGDEVFMSNTDGNFVIGNVYVYDHHMRDFKSTKTRVDCEDVIANGDFNSAYAAPVAKYGFNNVLQYIQTTNKNSLIGNMADEVTPAVVIQYILISDGSPLTPVKNSLNILEIQAAPTYLYNPGRGSVDYADLTSADAEIKKNRDEFVDKYLTSHYQSNKMKEYISFTSMTIAEFNGKNDDLIQTYDIIYIGDELQRHSGDLKDKYIYNVQASTSLAWNETALAYGTGGEVSTALSDIPIPVYNDSNMKGYIYYNIGDYHTSVRDGRLGGHIKNESATAQNGVDLRFPGRDFTRDKLTKLKEYLQANRLIIVAEELYGDNKINPTKVSGGDNGRVDPASNMYELLKYAMGQRWSDASGKYVTNDGSETAKTYENLVSAADLKMGTKQPGDLVSYVAATNIDLFVSEKPTEYGYETFTDDTAKSTVINPDSVIYNTQEDEDGQRILKYVFSIGEADTLDSTIDSQEDPKYLCYLYIDINNDGKYSKTTEDISDVKVVDGAGNSPAKFTDKTGEHYLLSAGAQYTMTRELPDNYFGIIKWKLVVQAKDNSSLRASEEGYTMVENITGEDRVVRILQITADTGSTLNLMWDLYSERQAMKNATAGTPVVHNKWGKYLYDVPDYDVEIRTLTVSEFAQLYKTEYDKVKDKYTAETFSKQFFADFVIKSEDITTDYAKNTYSFEGEEEVKGVDMLVLGFGDNFPGIENDEAALGIKAFIEEGNPILLTHDFVMFNSSLRQVKMFRHQVGMDKYGVTQNLYAAGNSVTTVTSDNLTHYFKNRWITNDTERNDGGLSYLYDGTGFYRSTAADVSKIAAIEGTVKEVAYEPGTEREKISKYTQGMSFYSQERFTNENTGSYRLSWYGVAGAPGATNIVNSDEDAAVFDTYGNVDAAHTSTVNATQDRACYDIEQLNEGKITHYPYILPERVKVSPTHSQYYELDLTSDNDSDGESDVVVWYTLGSAYDGSTSDYRTTGYGNNRYDDERGISLDPANGYYIYNKGNVTYTGAGDKSLEDADDFEIQLFVNTLLSTFDVGNVKPVPGFYDKTDSNASPISSIIVPYDENVTKPQAGETGVDSGVVKDKDGEYMYKFVDPNAQESDKDKGTLVYFKVDDKNLVRGNKKIAIRYFIETDKPIGTSTADANKMLSDKGITKSVEAIKLDEATSKTVINVSDLIKTYKVNSDGTIADTPLSKDTDKILGESSTDTEKVVGSVESGKYYALYLPMDLLSDSASFTIYLEAETTVTSVSALDETKTIEKTTGNVYIPLTVVKADLLDLD